MKKEIFLFMMYFLLLFTFNCIAEEKCEKFPVWVTVRINDEIGIKPFWHWDNKIPPMKGMIDMSKLDQRLIQDLIEELKKDSEIEVQFLPCDTFVQKAKMSSCNKIYPHYPIKSDVPDFDSLRENFGSRGLILEVEIPLIALEDYSGDKKKMFFSFSMKGRMFLLNKEKIEGNKEWEYASGKLESLEEYLSAGGEKVQSAYELLLPKMAKLLKWYYFGRIETTKGKDLKRERNKSGHY